MLQGEQLSWRTCLEQQSLSPITLDDEFFKKLMDGLLIRRRLALPGDNVKVVCEILRFERPWLELVIVAAAKELEGDSAPR